MCLIACCLFQGDGLQGEVGPKGEPGQRGEQGDDGEKGDRGVNGPKVTFQNSTLLYPDP